MKIALVIERMSPRGGGRERSLAEIAAELVLRGHDVTVLCRQGLADRPGVRVLELGAAGLGRAGRLASFARRVGQAVGREGYDVIHAVLPVPGCNVYQPRGGTIPGLRAARLAMADGPVRRAWRGLTFPFNLARLLAWRYERRLARDPGVACIGVSQMVAEEFRRFYRRHENVRVVYNGVAVPATDAATRLAWRTQWRRAWSADERTCVFLTPAQNFRLKGVAETVRAFAAYVDPVGAGSPHGPDRREAKLVIVGPGDAAAALRGIPDGVRRRIVLQPAAADVFPLYSGADAVLLLSWYDACSRVVLEAMRWGVPSLTTRRNGASELLAGGAGRIVESPLDTRGVVAAMADLADPLRRQEMAALCRRGGDFAGIARQVDQLLEVYRHRKG